MLLSQNPVYKTQVNSLFHNLRETSVLSLMLAPKVFEVDYVIYHQDVWTATCLAVTEVVPPCRWNLTQYLLRSASLRAKGPIKGGDGH